MPTIHQKSRLLTARAVQASWLVHLAIGCALAASQTQYAKQFFVPTENVSQQVELTSAFSEKTTQQLDTNFASPPVLISPGRAEFADQTYLETPSVEINLESIITSEVIEAAVAQASVYVSRVEAEMSEVSPTEQPEDEPTDEPETDLMPTRQAEETPAPSVDEVKPITTQRHRTSARPQVAGARASAPKRDLVAPNFSSNRPPRYPERAKLNKWEGVVLLKVEVDEHGTVTEVRVLRSSGYEILDAAAVNSVRSWHGTPAKWHGKPISSSWDLPVKFQL